MSLRVPLMEQLLDRARAIAQTQDPEVRNAVATALFATWAVMMLAWLAFHRDRRPTVISRRERHEIPAFTNVIRFVEMGDLEKAHAKLIYSFPGSPYKMFFALRLRTVNEIKTKDIRRALEALQRKHAHLRSVVVRHPLDSDDIVLREDPTHQIRVIETTFAPGPLTATSGEGEFYTPRFFNAGETETGKDTLADGVGPMLVRVVRHVTTNDDEKTLPESRFTTEIIFEMKHYFIVGASMNFMVHDFLSYLTNERDVEVESRTLPNFGQWPKPLECLCEEEYHKRVKEEKLNEESWYYSRLLPFRWVAIFWFLRALTYYIHFPWEKYLFLPVSEHEEEEPTRAKDFTKRFKTKVFRRQFTKEQSVKFREACRRGGKRVGDEDDAQGGGSVTSTVASVFHEVFLSRYHKSSGGVAQFSLNVDFARAMFPTQLPPWMLTLTAGAARPFRYDSTVVSRVIDGSQLDGAKHDVNAEVESEKSMWRIARDVRNRCATDDFLPNATCSARVFGFVPSTAKSNAFAVSSWGVDNPMKDSYGGDSVSHNVDENDVVAPFATPTMRIEVEDAQFKINIAAQNFPHVFCYTVGDRLNVAFHGQVPLFEERELAAVAADAFARIEKIIESGR